MPAHDRSSRLRARQRGTKRLPQQGEHCSVTIHYQWQIYLQRFDGDDVTAVEIQLPSEGVNQPQPVDLERACPYGIEIGQRFGRAAYAIAHQFAHAIGKRLIFGKSQRIGSLFCGVPTRRLAVPDVQS